MAGLGGRDFRGPPPIPPPMLHVENNKRKSFKILLRKIDSNQNVPYDDIFRITFKELVAPFTKIDTTKNGYHAITDDQRNIDKMLTPKALKAFQKNQPFPINPARTKIKTHCFCSTTR